MGKFDIKEAVLLSIDYGKLPDIIPVDFGNDLVLEQTPDLKPKIPQPRRVWIDCYCYGVSASMHYYVDIKCDGVDLVKERDGKKIKVFGYISDEFEKKNKTHKYDPMYRIEVLRKVTKEDIEAFPIRWKGYEVGDTTNAFNTKADAINQAKRIIFARFGKGWVFADDSGLCDTVDLQTE